MARKRKGITPAQRAARQATSEKARATRAANLAGHAPPVTSLRAKKVSHRQHNQVQQRLRDSNTLNKRLRGLLDDMQRQRDNHVLAVRRARRSAIDDRTSWISDELLPVQGQLADLQARLFVALSELDVARKKHEALQKKYSRLVSDHSARMEHAISVSVSQATTLNLMETTNRNWYNPKARAMIRDLMSVGVRTDAVAEVINIVSKCAGLRVIGHPSRDLVRRCVIEGGHASTIQIAEEMSQSSGITLSSDGSTHRSLNYTSHHAHISFTDRAPVARFLGLVRSPNHTTETQLNEWILLLGNIVKRLKDSPRGSLVRFTMHTIARKAKWFVSDHANDQRLLAKYLKQFFLALRIEGLAFDLLDATGAIEYADIVAEERSAVIESAGGMVAWDFLPAAEHVLYEQEIRTRIVARIGPAIYAGLSPSRRVTLEFFGDSRCGMHKNLNFVVAGNKAMKAAWALFGLTPPLPLPNKEKAGRLDSRDGGIQAGGVKSCQLFGMLFKPREKKRGYQDRFLVFMRQERCCPVTIPDVSNTRYGCHCDASAFILLHIESITTFLELVRKTKVKHKVFTNIEKNFWNALDDDPTLTEHAVLAIFGIAFSQPYLAAVRKPGVNALDLGPLHEQLRQHCIAVRDDPQLVTGALNADSHVRGAFLGAEYTDYNRAVLRCIQDFRDVGRMPYLDAMLQAFLRGVLECFDRFTDEWASDGLLATAPAELFEGLFAPATNDLNESQIARLRNGMLKRASQTLLYHNSLVSYDFNGTSRFVAQMPEDDQRHLRSAGLKLSAARLEQEDDRRLEEYEKEQLQAAEHELERQEQARLKTQQALNDIEGSSLFRTTAALREAEKRKKITKKILLENLRWYKARGDRNAWPKGVKLAAKVGQLREWLEAILAYNDSASHPVLVDEDGDSSWEDEGDGDSEIEDEDAMDVD